MISMIAAIDNNRVIGNETGQPWGKSQKADLRRFRKLTEYHTIILGRKTFDEFSQPLPNRKHIVVSSQDMNSEKDVAFMDLESAIHYAQEQQQEIFVIGGQQVFEGFLPFANKIYLTEIHADYEGSRYFPKLDKNWLVTSKSCFGADKNNRHSYCFIDYKR